MDQEINVFEKIENREIFERQRGKKPIGCKWIYIMQHKSDENLYLYKARLVRKEYTSAYDIDYKVTFPLVAKMLSVFILSSLNGHTLVGNYINLM